MRILHLYRPRLPSLRAQAIQVLHTTHALARRGHQVRVLADRGGEGGVEEALAPFGLEAPPGLELELAPTAWPPGAGLWFRSRLWAWCREPGVVYARAKRYIRLIPARIPVVIESHELDSALDREAGRDPAPAERLEREVLRRCSALVTNCEGTLALWEQHHGPHLPALRRVIHNATRQDRQVLRQPSAEIRVLYTGSPRDYKGLQKVFDSLPLWPAGVRLVLVGGTPAGTPAQVEVQPGVDYQKLPAVLATAHALLLPLEDNLFGRRLTSPLKLWDYLATGIPIVAADLPTVRAIAGELPCYYQPQDAASIAAAVVCAQTIGETPRRLRFWEDRAAEVEQVLAEIPR